MGLRELLILLLGLAIVAVILRGLYVAIQARRGQIRLAIDKNIPRDVDLEALELAELPGGGARVVRRGSEDDEDHGVVPEDSVSQANSRAESLELGRDDESVPVLMDTVQVGSVNKVISEADPEGEVPGMDAAETERWSEEDAAEDSWSEDEAWDGESLRTEPQISRLEDSQFSDSQSGEEDPDDVLFDYEESETLPAEDGLSAVQPDYPEDDSEELYEEDHASAAYDSVAEDGYEGDELYQDDVGEEPAFPEDFEAHKEFDEAAEDLESEANEELHEEPASRAEPQFNPDDLDDFSMTAGERIGGNPQFEEQTQASLFGSTEGNGEAPPVKRTSLFSALRGRIRSQVANLKESREEEPADLENEYLEPDFEESFVVQESVAEQPDNPPAEQPTEQLDIESSLEESGTTATDIPRAEPAATELRSPSPAPQRPEVKQQASSTQSSEVLVLNVMARDGREFRGEDLLHSVITSGLKFGDMQIFHRRFGNGGNGPVIFSLANILNPGTFDLNNMAQFSTIGVSLFMAMPTPINNLDGFEQMLDVAQQLCSALDGELKDDHRNVMTAQTIEHYRQRIRDFELRQLKTAGSRG